MSDEIQKNILTEICARHEQDQRWRNGPSMICPHAHDDRGWLLSEIERLRARVEVLEQLARESLHVLACREEDDDPGHWCVHCDEYVDRNGTHRSALRAALEATP
jgi:hypothetical protein